MSVFLTGEEEPKPQMDDKEAIDFLEKQIKALEQAGIDMSGDRTFFYVGEYDLALEGVYVAHKKHSGVALLHKSREGFIL